MDDFWAPMVEMLSNRVQIAEADADRLYSYMLTKGDKDEAIRKHIEAREARYEKRG